MNLNFRLKITIISQQKKKYILQHVCRKLLVNVLTLKIFILTAFANVCDFVLKKKLYCIQKININLAFVLKHSFFIKIFFKFAFENQF